ncbi:MAG: aspartate kinase, partial [Deltaproteobacteria bacterium]|nr:aspartate kinase [Deltaproteobacteria bacterium]
FEIVDKLSIDSQVIAQLDQELDRLLTGISMLGELSPRTRDALVSLGERISARLFAATLQKRNHSARAYDSWELGLTTNDVHACAEPRPECLGEISQAISAIEDGLTPVVTGFIGRSPTGDGRSPTGEITTLGRGGSDFSAALFGLAAEVEEIQIWTDVQGILRADPRVVPGAEVIPMIRFEEAAELAYFGAKVLHPRTIEPARRKNIPVRVLGTFQVDPKDPTPIWEQGTLIDDRAPSEPVRALALQRQVESLHVHSMRMLEAPGFLSRVFEILARRRISVDVIATSEVSISMTFDRTEGDLNAAIEEISTFAEVEREPNRSILCLVGSGLREDAGLLSRIFDILSQNQVPVYVISQGASRINITLVTDPAHALNGMRALYQELFG